MDKNFFICITICISMALSAYILADAIKYYTDGIRYEVVSGDRPLAYLFDKRTGGFIACNATNGFVTTFSLAPFSDKFIKK